MLSLDMFSPNPVTRQMPADRNDLKALEVFDKLSSPLTDPKTSFLQSIHPLLVLPVLK